MAAPTWSYSNEVRIAATLSAAAVVVLLGGLLVFLVLGQDELALADVLLGAGVFLILFTVLVVPFRLRGRGPMSYSLLVEGSMDEAESAVRAALEESGAKANVDVLRSRARRPPRAIVVDGVPARFLLRDAPYRQTSKEVPWTEIVQTGLEGTGDEDARALRERISARLATVRDEKE